MIFFSSPLDRAADRCVRAQFKLDKAERTGRDVADARAELRRAKANWQAACDSLRQERRNALTKVPLGGTRTRV